jgi:AcrR family transcriptional regulator
MSAPKLAAPAGTRERLLSAARELTVEGGYAAASVLAITQRAGLAAGTLYRHFPSKAELFVELFRSVCQRELEVGREAATREVDSTVERIELVLETFAERALRNPRLAWALIAEPVDPLVDAERLAYRAHYARLLAAGLHAAIAAGELPEQNVDFTAAALVGGVGEALVGPLSPPAGHPPQPEEVAASLRLFVHRAVGAGI